MAIVPFQLPSNPEVFTAQKKSYLGTPIASPLRIEAGKYFDDNGNEVRYEGLDLDIVVITVSRDKNIVITQVAGRSEPVIEYISSGSYQVTITGSLLNQKQHERPEDAIKTLSAICNASASLRVTCDYLQYFGIYELVIQRENFAMRPGFLNQQPFELNCISVKPFELVKE